MLKLLPLLAGLAVAFASECQTKYGGECHDVADGCPPHLEQVIYNYCGFQSHCCYSNNTSGTVLPDGSCGISDFNDNHRIVGGTLASPREFPWQVSVRRYGFHRCGGTVIDSQHVLTAAHCFRNDWPRFWTVGFGTTHTPFMTGSHERNVSLIHIHENYNNATDHNDIAVLKLSSPLDLSGPHVRAICLPQPGESFDGLTCTVTGWGTIVAGGHITENLRKVDLPIISNDLCSYYLGSTAHIVSSQMCAGVLEGGKDACQADSGGPLACQKDGVWKQAGVVSWGFGCALPNKPGVYTRVSEYLDWIHKNTQD